MNFSEKQMWRLHLDRKMLLFEYSALKIYFQKNSEILVRDASVKCYTGRTHTDCIQLERWPRLLKGSLQVGFMRAIHMENIWNVFYNFKHLKKITFLI